MANDVDSLTIVMDGQDHQMVPLASYAEFIGGVVAILESLDPRKTLLWRISDARISSPFQTTATAEAIVDDFEPKVVDRFLGAFQAAESGLPPTWLPSNVYQKATSLLNRVLSDSVELLELRSPGREAVRLRSAAPAKSGRSVKPRGWEYQDFTELEGLLQVADKHRSVPRFAVFDTLTNRRTECVATKEIFNRALQVMKRDHPRVSVSGRAKYNSAGQPVEMIVEELTELPWFDELIDPASVQGIDITGGVDSVDYVRSLRDAS